MRWSAKPLSATGPENRSRVSGVRIPLPPPNLLKNPADTPKVTNNGARSEGSCQQQLYPLFSRLVPVRALALWANSRLAHSPLARHPFVLAAGTTITGYFEGGQWHAHNVTSQVIHCQGYYLQLFP